MRSYLLDGVSKTRFVSLQIVEQHPCQDDELFAFLNQIGPMGSTLRSVVVVRIVVVVVHRERRRGCVSQLKGWFGDGVHQDCCFGEKGAM